MLTRSQVARRIGRSISTVRKMEGHVLHPLIDQLGVHWFVADEVEAIVEQVKVTGRALEPSEWGFESAQAEHRSRLRPRPARYTHNSDLNVGSRTLTNARGRVHELEKELSEIRGEHANWKKRIEESCMLLLDSLTTVDEDLLAAVEQLEAILAER